MGLAKHFYTDSGKYPREAVVRNFFGVVPKKAHQKATTAPTKTKVSKKPKKLTVAAMLKDLLK